MKSATLFFLLIYPILVFLSLLLALITLIKKSVKEVREK